MKDAITTLFNVTLPKVLASKKSMPGQLSIIVEGAGAWTMTLGENAKVEEGPSLDSDLVAVFLMADFHALMSGEAKEPVSTIGNVRLLQHFGRLLMPVAQNPIAARFAGAF